MLDADLVKRYVQHRDDAAFEALMRRHGPMVFGVCRRVLHDMHDAEDAFQATFLVLVRKASSLRSPGTIGNWLYGVACRTARHAREAAARRRAREASMAPPTAAVEDTGAELRPVLDRELERLPDIYRAVIVLCDLEGKTRKEAARQLHCPEGTVASRLATARKLLARRLARHGLALTAGTLTAAFSQGRALAVVPTAVMSSTFEAATLFTAGQTAAAAVVGARIAALAEGVMKTMLLARVKIVLLVLAIAVSLATGVAAISFSAPGASTGDEKAKTDSTTPAPRSRPRKLTADEAANAARNYRSEIDKVSIYVGYHAPEGAEGNNNQRWVILHVPKARPRYVVADLDDEDEDSFFRAARIESKQALRIIDVMAKWGFFKNAVNGPDPTRPCPNIVIALGKDDTRGLFYFPPWELGALRFVDAIRNCVGGEAGKALDRFLAPLEKQRRAWEKRRSEIDGRWKVKKGDVLGKHTWEAEPGQTWTIAEGKMSVRFVRTLDGPERGTTEEYGEEWTFELDPGKSPGQIDLACTAGVKKGSTVLGIYERKADQLKICFNGDGNRPRDFGSDYGGHSRFARSFVLERVKDDGPPTGKNSRR
jgi:RNA polymerase sigma factor (sigma-70 family)